MYSMEKLADDFCKLGIRAGQQPLHLVQKLLSTRLPAITSETHPEMPGSAGPSQLTSQTSNESILINRMIDAEHEQCLHEQCLH